MKFRLVLLFVFACGARAANAQHALPLIRSNAATITIRDGDRLRKDYWTLTPTARPDVYEADRTRRTKRVSFITDIDSITFTLKPGRSYDFIILLNGRDSCLTRVRSAIQDPAARVKEPWRSDTIPFTLSEQNNVLVAAILNERDTLWLMFHSAYRGVSIIKGVLDRAKSLHLDGSSEAHAWGGSAEEGFSKGNVIRIGRQRWEDLEVAIDEQSGKGSDGKFGYDLFADKVVELNYDRKVMVIHNRLPRGMSGYARWPINYESGSFFVDGMVGIAGHAYPERFMFHTGYGGQFILGTGFMERYDLYDKLDTVSVEELKDSFGNPIRNVTTEVESLRIGKERASHVRGSVMDPKARFPSSVLGSGSLKNFNMLIDLRNDMIHVKPRRAAGS